MSIDRRSFFKFLGITGLTVIGLKASGEDSTPEDDSEFYGVLYDSSICIGCRACEKACAKAHNLPEPEDEMEAGVKRKTSETQRCAANAFDTEEGEVYVRNQCMH